MSVVKRTIIVLAADAQLARSLTAGIAGPSGSGMFVVPYSATGAAPATHYVSSGPIHPQFAALLADVNAMHAAAHEAGFNVTLAQCQALLARSTVQDAGAESALATLARLGLKAVTP
jgi:hypothetical protein